MLLCGVAHRGRVDGGRIGESTLERWFAGGRCELLEARRRGDLQQVQRLFGADEEGVRQADGEEHKVAWSGNERLSVTAELGSSGEHVEHFVFHEVSVQGRCEPGWVEELRDSHAAAGLSAGRLDCDEVSREPKGLAFLRPQEEWTASGCIHVAPSYSIVTSMANRLKVRQCRDGRHRADVREWIGEEAATTFNY